jgi:hypothetical protein
VTENPGGWRVYKLRHWPPGTDKSTFVPFFFDFWPDSPRNVPSPAPRFQPNPASNGSCRMWGGDPELKRSILSLIFALAIVAAYAVPASMSPGSAVHAQWSDPQADVPAYHPLPPPKGQPLPAILSGDQLTGPFFREKWQVEVYKEAAEIPDVLYQLPCYCHCDRALGHTSLHSCFEGTHGAICATCAAEGAYAYKMTKLGKTPQQIREGIERKEYESVDLDALGRS